MVLPLVPCVGAAVAGHASWLFYFHRFECHMHGWTYLITYLASWVAVFLSFARVNGLSLVDSFKSTTAVGTAFLVGLYGSLLVWRIFLNPLNQFPGSFGARVGNLYFAPQLGKSDFYKQMLAQHKKHGRIVRIGSNDLSITDPNIMEAAYGPKAKTTKGWWYDNDAPLSSMHTTRDKALHDKRRKVWAPAFSEKAIRDYETRISGLSTLLVEKLGSFKSEPVDVRVWFNLFSFDAMALLAFGKNYGMLEKGEKHWALELLDEGMQPLAYFFPSWFFRLLTKIPGAAEGYQKFVKFCVDELSWRVKNASESESKGGSDMMAWILRAYQGIDRPDRDPMLQADARLIIVAGSDTTAAAFTYLFYYLAKDPSQVKKLREELKPLLSGDWSDKDINQAQHLNGCIWEALRLHPPVPSGVQRVTPPEGMEVDGRHVPGNTAFWMPGYVMARGKTRSRNSSYASHKLTPPQTKKSTLKPSPLCQSGGTPSLTWSSTRMPGRPSLWAPLAASARVWL